MKKTWVGIAILFVVIGAGILIVIFRDANNNNGRIVIPEFDMTQSEDYTLRGREFMEDIIEFARERSNATIYD